MESSVVLFKPRIHLFACTHPSVSITLDCNDWLVYKHQSPPCVSNMSRLWILIAHTHQSPALCLKHVWMMVQFLCASVSLQPFDQTRLDCGSLLYTSIVSNAFGLWILVYVHASVSSPVFQTRLDKGSVSVYKHLSPPVFQTHFVVPRPCTCISLQPCVSNTFGSWFLIRVHHQSTNTFVVSCLCTLPPTPK